MTCSPCTVGVREGAVGITFQFEGEEFDEDIEGDFERLKGLINQPRIEDFAPILSEKPLEIDLIRGGINQMVDDAPQAAAEDESC